MRGATTSAAALARRLPAPSRDAACCRPSPDAHADAERARDDDAPSRARGPVPRRTTTCCCNGPRSSPRQRELMVLRVAWRTRSRYEWVQHLRLAPRVAHHRRRDRRDRRRLRARPRGRRSRPTCSRRPTSSSTATASTTTPGRAWPSSSTSASSWSSCSSSARTPRWRWRSTASGCSSTPSCRRSRPHHPHPKFEE